MNMICGFVVQNDVPLPEPRTRSPRTPLGTVMQSLQVGESFMVGSAHELELVRGRITSLRPKKFATRKVEHQGWRIWRTE